MSQMNTQTALVELTKLAVIALGLLIVVTLGWQVAGF